MENNCIGCRHCEQGESSSFCGNKNQSDESLKKYVYWNFSCPLFQKGMSLSRFDFMEKEKKDNILNPK